MNKLYLLGAGGHGKVLMEAAFSAGKRVVGVFDDAKSSGDLLGVPILGVLDKTIDAPLVLAIGNNQVRRKVAQNLSCQFDVLIHSRSYISGSAEVGVGSCMLVNTIINSDTRIGTHVIVNSGAIIDHDCEVGDFVHIAPGAVVCGHVKIGDETLIGAGSTVVPGIQIGKGAVIQAGASVLTDVPDCHMLRNNGKLEPFVPNN